MPPAIPQSIWPRAMLEAMVVSEAREEAQARLEVLKLEVTGRPAAREAMRPALEPPSSLRTVPMLMSEM